MVDYLGLMLPNHKSDSMYKDGISVSEELRALSYVFKVPVISAVQCNSEGMANENIDMQNVADSRGIVHGTDFLAALYQRPEDRENGIINVRIIKNRLGGQIGKVSSFTMDPETVTVADITFDNNVCITTDEPGISDALNNLPNISSDLNGI